MSQSIALRFETLLLRLVPADGIEPPTYGM